ncbi:MAG: hypothetical protein FJX77_12695 [Armatimonadetes bacterium]|nr:hypothetical protein [Armatimonadota bacterium]
MSEPETRSGAGKAVPPDLRRGVDRRALLTDELRKASRDAVRSLPGFGGLLGLAFRETTAQRDERLVRNLWQLLMGREPKNDEAEASLELMRNARLPDEKGDALVDIAWALCQTRDFEELERPDSILVRGLYRLVLEREPDEEEKARALELMADTAETGAKGAVLEGLLTGLVRSAESVLRKDVGPGTRR